MSSIRVSGNTSGHYDLTVPDVAGSNTIALDKIVVTDSNGNVGIGTDSPSHPIHIQGDGTGGTVFGIENTSTGGEFWRFYSTGSANSEGAGNLLLRGGNVTPQMTIQSGGNVGVGTTSPETKLDIRSATATYLTVGNTTDNTSGLDTGIVFKQIGNIGNPATIQVIGNLSPTSGSAYTAGFKFQTGDWNGSAFSSVDAMTIAASGNVGIGTDNPSTKLHIKGGSNEDAELRLFPSDGDMDAVISFTGQDDNTTTEGAQIWYDNNVGDLHIVSSYDHSNGGIRFHTRQPGHKQEGNERLTIASDGNVGIGTASPEVKLDVTSSRSTGYSSTSDQRGLAHITARNSSDAAGRFASISLVSGGGTQAEGSINLVQTGNYTGDLTFKLRAGGGSADWRERMRIDSSGYVTKPNHPAFQALAVGASNANAGGYLNFTHTQLNTGNHFSITNNRFIAPVTGTYHFHFHAFIDQGNTATGQIAFYKNGGYSFNGYEIRNYHTHRSTGYGPTMALTATIGLAANDYIQVYTTIDLHANTSNYFGGHLIG